MSISPISAITASPAFNSIDSMVSPLRPEAAAPGMETQGTLATAMPGDKTDAPGKSFGQMLTNAIAEVNQAQNHASDMTARFAAGEPLDVHQVMIASQEASVALNLTMQVRNKLVDAYTEIMHVNV